MDKTPTPTTVPPTDDRIERHDGTGMAPASCEYHIHGERDPTPGRRCRDCGAPIR